MEGIPVLYLWNLVLEVFYYNKNQSNETKGLSAQGEWLHRLKSSKCTKNQTQVPTMHDSSELFSC